jgi:hypothetical protein
MARRFMRHLRLWWLRPRFTWESGRDTTVDTAIIIMVTRIIMAMAIRTAGTDTVVMDTVDMGITDKR